MRRGVIVVGLVLALASPSWAQAFDDVPPWHWAYDAVQALAAAGIIVGYPAADRDRAVNAVAQIYDAFAHAAHPAAREWAERFLANLPADWPQPLQRSRLVGFRLVEPRLETAGGRILLTAQVIAALRTGGGISEGRAMLRVDLQRDGAGRLRANYAALAAAQPELFR